VREGKGGVKRLQRRKTKEGKGINFPNSINKEDSAS